MKARPLFSRVELLCLLAVALVLGAVLDHIFSTGSESEAAVALWAVFFPGWILSIALFGGIHGAPAWSSLPSCVLAVLLECALAWMVLRKFIRKREKHHAS